MVLTQDERVDWQSAVTTWKALAFGMEHFCFDGTDAEVRRRLERLRESIVQASQLDGAMICELLGRLPAIN